MSNLLFFIIYAKIKKLKQYLHKRGEIDECLSYTSIFIFHRKHNGLGIRIIF